MLQKGSSEIDGQLVGEHCGGYSEEQDGVEETKGREFSELERIFLIWKSFKIVVI